jgi:hypothetical protein
MSGNKNLILLAVLYVRVPQLVLTLFYRWLHSGNVFTAISILGLPNFMTHLGIRVINPTIFCRFLVSKNDEKETLLKTVSHSVQQNVEPDHNGTAAERTMAAPAR